MTTPPSFLSEIFYKIVIKKHYSYSSRHNGLLLCIFISHVYLPVLYTNHISSPLLTKLLLVSHKPYCLYVFILHIYNNTIDSIFHLAKTSPYFYLGLLNNTLVASLFIYLVVCW